MGLSRSTYYDAPSATPTTPSPSHPCRRSAASLRPTAIVVSARRFAKRRSRDVPAGFAGSRFVDRVGRPHGMPPLQRPA